MKNVRTILASVAFLGLLPTFGQWNDFGGNSISSTEYLGANTSSTVPLLLKTVANQPIDFSTADLFRARINEKISYSIGPSANDPRDGFTLLSGRSNFMDNVKGPFSRLHLADDVGDDTPNVYAQEIGYRGWMRNGITFTGNSDQAYIGQKYDEDDNTDFVIQWSDNENGSPWGVDRMKFIFSSQFTNDHSGMGSEYGLEAMRFWPKNSKEVNVGIGDFFAYGGDPTERLHVRDGRVRIQQLPDDDEANAEYRVMVVDDSNDPNERGVVKWATLPSTPGSDCDWIIQTGTNHVCNTYNGSSCPWNADNFVGIGTQYPKAKLQISADNSSPYTTGVVTYSQLWTTVLGGQSIWGEARTPLTTQFLNSTLTGVRGTASNARYSWGVNGTAEINAASPSPAVDIIGVRGVATGNGNASRTVGVYGSASGAINSNDWAAWFDGEGFLGATTWTYSDANLKQGVEDLSTAEMATALMQLHPKSYTFISAEYPYLHFPNEPQRGLISQEVDSVFPDLVKDVVRPEQVDSLGNVIEPELNFKAMNYNGLIPVLIAGFQHQQQMIDQQQATIAQMQDQINNCCAAQGGMAPQGSFEQRMAPQENDLQEQRLLIIPNPVADLTTLEYYVPKAGKVSLQVSTSDGKPLATLREELAETGAYNYSWNTTKLAAGTYFCTFMLDGAVVVKRAVKVAR